MDVREDIEQQADNGGHRRDPGYARPDEPPAARGAVVLLRCMGAVVAFLPRPCLPLELGQVGGELAHLGLEGDHPPVYLPAVPEAGHGRACFPAAGALAPLLAWRPWGWLARLLASRAR